MAVTSPTVFVDVVTAGVKQAPLVVLTAPTALASLDAGVPIMVAAMIICAHIPWLRPIAILLSHEGLPDQDETEDESQHLDAA